MTLDPTKPTAYSYIRFSSPEQAKGASLVRQVEKSRQYAAANGLQLDDSLTFQDLGVSAYRSSNAGPGGKLHEFLELVKQGHVPRGSFLLIESLDRLSRDTISVAAQLLLGLLNEGIQVVTLVDGQVYRRTGTPDDFTQLLVSLTYLQRANDESRTKGLRVADAWQRKRDAAATKKLTRMCPAWMELSADRSEYVLIPDRVAIVREIVDWTRQGLGRASITKRLNERNIPSIGATRRKRPGASSTGDADVSWHPSYIHKILTSRALVGEFQPSRVSEDGKKVPDGPPVPGYFPRVLEDAEFDLVQSLITNRGGKSGGRRGATFSNLFSGLVKCGYCGSTMTYIDKGIDTRGKRDNRRNRFLLCQRANRAAGCHRVPWVYHEFEDSFFELATKTDFADFISQSNDRAERLRSLTDALAIAQQRLAHNKETQRNLVDALGLTVAQPNAIVERLLKLESEAVVLGEEIQQLERDRTSQRLRSTQHAEAIAALAKVKEQLESTTGDEAFLYRASLNQHLRRVVERISLYPGGLLATEAEAQAAATRLLASGHPPLAVSEVVAAMFRIAPVPAQRTFVVENSDKRFSDQVLSPEHAIPDLEQLFLQAAELRKFGPANASAG